MAAKFKHFLITRFNVPQNNPDWEYDRTNRETLTHDWLIHRIEIFKQYTLPSVLNQRSTDFIWLLFFNSRKLNELKDLLESLSKHNFIKCLFVYDPWDMDKQIRLQVEHAHEQSSFEYLISSRMDNDDCLHPEFIKEIQKHYKANGRQVINFDDGYILKLAPNAALFEHHDLSNAFVSLIEEYKSAEELELVFSGSHLRFMDDQDLIRIKGKRYWMQLVHQRNLANTIQGRAVLDRTVLNAFGIKLKLKLGAYIFYSTLIRLKHIKAFFGRT